MSSDEEFNVDSTEDFDFKRSLTVLTDSKQIDIKNRFKRESDAFYLEAKRSVVSTTSKIPSWAIVMIIILGWNEFMTILKNPIYLVLSILVLSGVYVLHALNLWGPAERVITAVTNEVTGMVKAQIADTVHTTGTGSQEYQMSDFKDKSE